MRKNKAPVEIFPLSLSSTTLSNQGMSPAADGTGTAFFNTSETSLNKTDEKTSRLSVRLRNTYSVKSTHENKTTDKVDVVKKEEEKSPQTIEPQIAEKTCVITKFNSD